MAYWQKFKFLDWLKLNWLKGGDKNAPKNLFQGAKIDP